MSAPVQPMEKALRRMKAKLIGFRRSIRAHEDEGIDYALSLASEGVIDINYSDADETSELPILDAIKYAYDYAFDSILKHPTFKVDALNFCNLGPLGEAAYEGNERYIHALLARGADPTAYYGRTLISAALENISNYAVLTYSDFNTTDPESNGNNPDLKRELADFFYQRGKYAGKKTGLDERGVPFPDNEVGVPFQRELAEPLQAYYRGKAAVIGLLLSKGVNPTISAEPTEKCPPVSPLSILEDPEKYQNAFYGCQGLVCLGYEGDLVLKFKFKFHNQAQDCASIDIIVYYDLKPTRDMILSYKQQLSAKDQAAVEALSKQFADSHQQIQRKMKTETDRIDRGLFYLDGQVQMNQVAVQSIGYQVQMNGMAVQSLAYQAQPAIEAAHVKKAWETLRLQISLNKLADVFCRHLNLGLRSFVGAKEVLSSKEVQRKADWKESLTTGVLDIIGDHIPLFGGIVKAVSKGISVTLDWRADKLNERIAAQFAFVAKEDFCDRTALEITQGCLLFDQKLVKTEKDAKKLAEHVLAFLLYVMSSGAIEPRSIRCEEDLRKQVVDMFVQGLSHDKYYRSLVERLEDKNQPTQAVLMFSSVAVLNASGVVAQPVNGNGPNMDGSGNGEMQVQPYYANGNGYNGRVDGVPNSQAATSTDHNNLSQTKNSPCCVIL